MPNSALSAFIINRMGIDIYAKWDGMSEAEEAAQITGFSVEHGHVGYPPLSGRVSHASAHWERGVDACALFKIGKLPRPRPLGAIDRDSAPRKIDRYCAVAVR
jgi:hypothetical protein